jgi:hypothetical protein
MVTFDHGDKSGSLDHYGRLLAFVVVNLGGENTKGHYNVLWLCINKSLEASDL